MTIEKFCEASTIYSSNWFDTNSPLPRIKALDKMIVHYENKIKEEQK